MFNFIVRYFGFLKAIPLVALVFDCILKLWTLITNPTLSDLLDEIETEVLTWPGTKSTLHKYGGTQFDYQDMEIGHIHSNGLLDLLLNLKTKQQLLAEGRVTDHHTFTKSGWVSFTIKNKEDKANALALLRIAYLMHCLKHAQNQLIHFIHPKTISAKPC
jgi:hypothetical protein